MQDLPLQGSIADVFFPRLIARLHQEGFEGVVRVSLGATSKILYFRKGEIASAASNAESDRLANILIQDGRLTPPQLELAKSRMESGLSLGKVLIELGFLTPAELLQGARRQVQLILASCFTLPRGFYKVEAGPLASDVTVLGLSTRRLIFDCLMQARDRQWIVREMGSMESVYRPAGTLHEGLDAMKLDAEVDQLARRLDGSQTLRDLSAQTSLDDFEVSKVVLALEVLGLAELVGSPIGHPQPPPSGRAIPVEPDVAAPDPEPIDMPEGIPLDLPEEDVPVRTHASAPPGGGNMGVPPADESGPAGEPPPDETAAEPPITGRDDSAEPSLVAEGGPSEATAPDEGAEALPDFIAHEPVWEVDPRTGERVHTGPIELTFDGTVPSHGDRPRTLRRLLPIVVVVTVAVAALFVYLTRRGGESGGPPAQVPPVSAEARPATTPTPAPEHSPSPS
ncbi:MAG TPA: DUF4388 domain-containing protein, partial [Candidatus Saccharimonadales bacterium]|nr:DUF4388 domain-containing protein [Candidatus Saccharimonadales bacterium]